MFGMKKYISSGKIWANSLHSQEKLVRLEREDKHQQQDEEMMKQMKPTTNKTNKTFSFYTIKKVLQEDNHKPSFFVFLVLSLHCRPFLISLYDQVPYDCQHTVVWSLFLMDIGHGPYIHKYIHWITFIINCSTLCTDIALEFVCPLDFIVLEKKNRQLFQLRIFNLFEKIHFTLWKEKRHHGKMDHSSSHDSDFKKSKCTYTRFLVYIHSLQGPSREKWIRLE